MQNVLSQGVNNTDKNVSSDYVVVLRMLNASII